ncbi:MAG TPA: 16S rRNA (guanine(966)-N(2))-methyltransferase RsmD [Dokdonella sp.]|nr:16S rRNA (guanine(966)-N(2))-methyltransferase RsmD [Dokdonella sp.]
MRNPPAKSAHGAVRIVAGRLRGSRLAVPVREGLRPTPDRVRETLFNWLMPYLPGMRCLDLYAGTGALGIEALSRGAGACTFVERDRELCRALADNLARLRVAGADVVHADAAGWLTGAATPYDLVFLDPPFDAGLWQGAAAAIEQGGWLADGGFAYVESPREARFELPSTWVRHREGVAGAVRHALYRRSGAVPLS